MYYVKVSQQCKLPCPNAVNVCIKTTSQLVYNVHVSNLVL